MTLFKIVERCCMLQGLSEIQGLFRGQLMLRVMWIRRFVGCSATTVLSATGYQGKCLVVLWILIHHAAFVRQRIVADIVRDGPIGGRMGKRSRSAELASHLCFYMPTCWSLIVLVK